MSFFDKQMRKQFAAGEIIFKENDPGMTMFIVEKGEVEITKIINKQNVKLATLRDGEIFGEMSLIDGRERSATVVAVKDSVCLEITKMAFHRRMDEVPPWMKSFYGILVDRLRLTNESHTTMGKREIARQIVFILALFLSYQKSDIHDKLTLPWKKSSEDIAFLINVPLLHVNKVMNMLSYTSLASSEIHYEKGKLFVVNNLKEFMHFAEFCKEKYYTKLGRELSTKYQNISTKEMKLLKFIKELLDEQGGATDINESLFNENFEEKTKISVLSYHTELKNFHKTGILKVHTTGESEKYFVIDREMVKNKLKLSSLLNRYDKIERKLIK